MKKKRRYEVAIDKELSSCSEMRYVVVDSDNGEVLDNAQGYGYKTVSGAYAAYSYQRSHNMNGMDKNLRQDVKNWIAEHRDFVKDSKHKLYNISMKELKELFESKGYKIEDLPFDIAAFRRFVFW